MARGEDGRRSFGVLGPLQIRLDGRAVPITAGKARAAVAALLLHANRPVAIPTLIDHVWSDPPKTARTMLHTLVLRLRRAFGEHHILRTTESGYLLDVGPGEFDLDRFGQLVASAEQARAQHDAAAEREHLVAALALWRGPAFADVPSDALQRVEAERLHELRFSAQSRRVELDLALGRHAELVGELRRMTEVDPWRERSWAHLMTALHRCGRQADALAVYRELRAKFVRELGVEPAAELQELHRAMLAGELPGPEARAVAGRPHAWSALCQLPPVAGDFTGRDADHDLLVERLSSADGPGPAVIWGAPGIGKSTLAVRVAHSLRPTYPDGQWYCELRSRGSSRADPVDTSELLAELLVASGMPIAAVPRTLPARAAAWRARLADRRVLVVLDDVADVDQVGALLPGTGACAVLITSRSALGTLPGCHRHRLLPLAPAEATAMIGRIIGERRVAAEPAATRRIALHCAGLPLALRIVSARLAVQPAQPLTALADRLQDERGRLDELSTADLTLRAELRHSYRALDERAQHAFRCVGMLPAGDFPAWALGALVDGSDGQHLVERLSQASLLETAAPGIGGQPRFSAHALVALYAEELAGETGPALVRAGVGRLLGALLDRVEPLRQQPPHFLEALPVGDPPPRTAPPADGADAGLWVHAERRVVLSTIEHACSTGWLREATLLAAVTVPALARLGDFARLHRTSSIIHRAGLDQGDELTAWRAGYGYATLALTIDLHEAVEWFERCVDAFERLRAPLELGYALAGLASSRTLRGTPDSRSADRAVRIAQSGEHVALRALALRTLGDVLAAEGRPARARRTYEEALEQVATLRAPSLESDILLRYSRCLLADGHPDKARTSCRIAMDRAESQHNDNGLAWCLGLYSELHRQAGDHRLAVHTARRAVELMVRTGDLRGEAVVSLDLAAALLATGRGDEARGILARSTPTLDEMGARRAAAHARRLQQGVLAGD